MEEQKKGMDLTVGEPMRLLILFAVPMLIGSIFQLLYNMVDTMVLGRFVGAEALAAVGATSSTTGLIMMLGNALSNAMSILVSQSWGAKDERGLRRIMGHAFGITLVSGLCIGLLSFFLARPLMLLLGTPENIVGGSVRYVRITCGLFIAQMFYNASASVLRAIGDSRTPLYFLVLCSVLNIVLDILFVKLFPDGVSGVAWATVLSQMISAALCCAYMWKKFQVLRFSRMDLAPDSAVMRRFFAVALPMAAQNVMLSVGMMVITSVINSFGSDIVAAYTVGSKVEQLVTVVVSQVAFSFSVYSGQNYGAKAYDRIDLGIRRALVLLGGLTAVSMAILFAFGAPLARMFVEAGETVILDAAVKMIRVDASFMPALCAIWLYNSALRGMGEIAPTVASSVLELFSKIGFSVGLSKVFGYMGIWFAGPLGWIIGLIPSMGYYYFGKWKKKALARDTEEMGHAV